MTVTQHIPKDTPEFFVAAGMMGMDCLCDNPFQPVRMAFRDEGVNWYYLITDPRAIRMFWDGLQYYIGIARNETKGVKDVYHTVPSIAPVDISHTPWNDQPEEWSVFLGCD